MLVFEFIIPDAVFVAQPCFGENKPAIQYECKGVVPS